MHMKSVSKSPSEFFKGGLTIHGIEMLLFDNPWALSKLLQKVFCTLEEWEKNQYLTSELQSGSGSELQEKRQIYFALHSNNSQL